MKAKVIETGEIIDVLSLYPVVYSRLDCNGKLIEEYDEDELEFINDYNKSKVSDFSFDTLPEEKRLLYSDLFPRLLYGIKVKIYDKNEKGIEYTYETSLDISNINRYISNDNIVIKPYLRDMSSMTKEEDDEYTGTMYVTDYGNFVTSEPTFRTFDWLNRHHFDYRNLINRGLALSAPENLYIIS